VYRCALTERTFRRGEGAMSFDVEVSGHASRALHLMLSELIGESSVHVAERCIVLSITDQAELISVISYLNDVGVVIERVQRVHRTKA
jgi:hypothetical protein